MIATGASSDPTGSSSQDGPLEKLHVEARDQVFEPCSDATGCGLLWRGETWDGQLCSARTIPREVFCHELLAANTLATKGTGAPALKGDPGSPARWL